MPRSADAQTRRNVAMCLTTARHCLNDAYRWTQQERRPEMASHAQAQKVQALQERRRAAQLRIGGRAVVMLTKKQATVLHNVRFEGLNYIISSSDWLEFRPEQLERWGHVLKACKVLRPSQQRSIQGLWLKLHRRAKTVSKKGWKL
jgi:hypothetical protein